MPYALYIASALGAAALLMMMPRQGYTPLKLGMLAGAVTLGGLWLLLARQMPDAVGLDAGAWPYYYVFSAIAIASAARVITHTKPVYAALWFIMVVIATAGLFLTLAAEFMAFAMVIIYGGAILVTYMFVIMLASQSGDTTVVHTTAESDATEDEAMTSPVYDRVAREPLAACAVGFVLLAVLLAVMFPGEAMRRNPAMAAESDSAVVATLLPERAARRLPEDVAAKLADAGVTDAAGVSNVERVGLDLFQRHPLGIELAGVILLVSLVGAVVIARTRVTADGTLDGTLTPTLSHPRNGERGPEQEGAR